MKQLNSIFVLLGLITLICASFSQDTTRPVQDTVRTRTDTTFRPLKFILEETKYNYLSSLRPDTITRNRFLWFPLKSIDNVFDYLPGFYLREMDAGQVNQLNYNQLDHSNTGVLRHGRPINDLIDGSIDLNLLSRNEISEIELSNGYGNTQYRFLNTVNIIQRQVFQYRPYTELAFWQDRYENVYVDANFSQNFTRGFNFNFGITKHSYEGKYRNSDFDKWLGRFNFNLAPSKNLNFFLYANYAKLQRGLNEGVDPDTVDITNRETMFNQTLAIVRNSDSYEIKERFDADGGAVFRRGISFTRLQFYVSNSFRKYRDEENRQNPNGITTKNNEHWINYGTKLEEILEFRINKKAAVVSRTEVEYNNIITQINLLKFNSYYTFHRNYNTITLVEDLQASYRGLNAGGYIRGYKLGSENKISFYGGVKGSYTLQFDSLNSIMLVGLYNSLKQYYSFGAGLYHSRSYIKGEYYSYQGYGNTITSFASGGFDVRGINASLGLKFIPVDLDVTMSYNIDTENAGKIFPEISGNACLSYHDIGIKGKLEYKIGLNTRFWTKYFSNQYAGEHNSFFVNPVDSVRIPADATLDVFIMGKIGRATFGITFENILDRLIYNMGVYPHIDRGGLFNAWSRFNITWTFFD